MGVVGTPLYVVYSIRIWPWCREEVNELPTSQLLEFVSVKWMLTYTH